MISVTLKFTAQQLLSQVNKMSVLRVCFLLYFAGISIGKPPSNKTGDDGLVTRFDVLVNRFKREFSKIIEEDRKEMKAEVKAFNAEKQRMKEIEVNNDDIVQLNVGGQKFTTTRFTLRQVNGSLLATMFSRNWKHGLKRDQDGAVVLDFNPEHFGWILNYLRAMKISTPEKLPIFRKVPNDEIKNFNILLKYLGLADEIVPVQNERFHMRSSIVSLQENGRVAVHDSTKGHSYVLEENVHKHGTVRFKLKLESFQNNYWMFVGILKADVVPRSVYPYSWTGTYGWVLGSSGSMFKNGVNQGRGSWNKLSKQGDTVSLILDCDSGKLSLHLPTGQQYDMAIPSSQSWRLVVDLYGANDKIRIVEVVQD